MNFGWTDAQRQASLSKRIGNQSEKTVAGVLFALGFSCIEQVHDSWVPVKRSGPAGHWLCRKGGVKLSGDLRAVWAATGQSVLVECKWEPGDRLPRSRLSKGQHHKMSEHMRSSGISLIAWHRPGEVFLIVYPPFWRERTSITIDTARKFNLSTQSRIHRVATAILAKEL